jgi:hypothetical protein
MWIEKITYCYCWKILSRYEARKRLFLKNATFCISNCVFPILLTENAATVLADRILNFFGIFNLPLMACKWHQLRKSVWRPKHCIFHRVNSLYIFTLWLNTPACSSTQTFYLSYLINQIIFDMQFYANF